ncbi:Aste57867_21719 [Aphanomyces stellatus]|uniref:Aste57867_21719 protein n=1 Tax=Aphanomyces stellatus TaxID=120398 RepID=A0A485LIA1_9STRA|nr:hypothetical protein As57867_021650 [Aphanomyces stellatus]VFT98388.1 Aste57867_21719 [Aphanomyces stellatus]
MERNIRVNFKNGVFRTNGKNGGQVGMGKTLKEALLETRQKLYMKNENWKEFLILKEPLNIEHPGAQPNGEIHGPPPAQDVEVEIDFQNNGVLQEVNEINEPSARAMDDIFNDFPIEDDIHDEPAVENVQLRLDINPEEEEKEEVQPQQQGHKIFAHQQPLLYIVKRIKVHKTYRFTVTKKGEKAVGMFKTKQAAEEAQQD